MPGIEPLAPDEALTGFAPVWWIELIERPGVTPVVTRPL